MPFFDVIVLGAGAAGLFCAGIAGQRGLSVLLVDHSPKIAEKIRISGGGRCNFTNRDCTAANFLSDNPSFCRSALARFTPSAFTELLDGYGIGYHEKHRGQLFCDGSSEGVIRMLLAECALGAVTHWQPCTVHSALRSAAGFELQTSRGSVRGAQLVVATGGLSVPKAGASDLGYRLARQFGHRLVEPRPALVPLTFDATTWAPFAALAGVSLEVEIVCGDRQKARFVEDLLFTHRGLSGPAVLQISTYWRPGRALRIGLADERALSAGLRQAKSSSRRQLGNELGAWLPQRLADVWLRHVELDATTPMAQLRDRDIDRLAAGLARWEIVPNGSEGWRKAEVTAGGVDTRELDGQSLHSRLVRGLHFIGEVVDVTGWLGGYNFQWAWASASACAQALVDGRALANGRISG